MTVWQATLLVLATTLAGCASSRCNGYLTNDPDLRDAVQAIKDQGGRVGIMLFPKQANDAASDVDGLVAESGLDVRIAQDSATERRIQRYKDEIVGGKQKFDIAPEDAGLFDKVTYIGVYDTDTKVERVDRHTKRYTNTVHIAFYWVRSGSLVAQVSGTCYSSDKLDFSGLRGKVATDIGRCVPGADRLAEGTAAAGK